MENHLIEVFLYIVFLGLLAGTVGCILNNLVKSFFK